MSSGFGANLSFDVDIVEGGKKREREAKEEEGREEAVRDGFAEWVATAALWEGADTSPPIVSRARHVETATFATHALGYDDWLLEKRVRFRPLHEPGNAERELDVGDSCCFGTSTVELGGWEVGGGVRREALPWAG